MERESERRSYSSNLELTSGADFSSLSRIAIGFSVEIKCIMLVENNKVFESKDKSYQESTAKFFSLDPLYNSTNQHL